MLCFPMLAKINFVKHNTIKDNFKKKVIIDEFGNVKPRTIASTEVSIIDLVTPVARESPVFNFDDNLSTGLAAPKFDGRRRLSTIDLTSPGPQTQASFVFFLPQKFCGNSSKLLRKSFVSMGVQGCLLFLFLL